MMKKLNKKLNEGIHVLSLPIGEEMSIEDLFPVELSGAIIEKLTPSGTWILPETVQYTNGSFSVSDTYKTFQPLETIRLTLKRPVTLEWQVDFRSLSGLKPSEIIFESGFNDHEALLAANLSTLVYEDPETIYNVIESQYDFDETHYFSAQSHETIQTKNIYQLLRTFLQDRKNAVDLQFLYLSKKDLVTNETLIVVIFQGSKEIVDWATNLSSKEVAFLECGHVHNGFENSFKLFIDSLNKQSIELTQIFNNINANNIQELSSNTKIILAGHSLGGAIATLAGCFLIESGYSKENLDVYTFGAPPHWKPNLLRLFSRPPQYFSCRQRR